MTSVETATKVDTCPSSEGFSKLTCDLFPFLEGRGRGGGSARPYPNKRTLCTRFFFCIPLDMPLAHYALIPPSE